MQMRIFYKFVRYKNIYILKNLESNFFCLFLKPFFETKLHYFLLFLNFLKNTKNNKK